METLISPTALLKDDLTGLYNRQGFLAMAERHLKAAERGGRKFFINCIVLNNLKDIEIFHGRTECDWAVGTTAQILTETFRTSDLIGRVGSDRFAVIASETSSYTPKILKARLQKNQTYYNSQFNHCKLSVSVCATAVDPVQIKTVHDLWRKLDEIFFGYQKDRAFTFSFRSIL